MRGGPWGAARGGGGGDRVNIESGEFADAPPYPRCGRADFGSCTRIRQGQECGRASGGSLQGRGHGRVNGTDPLTGPPAGARDRTCVPAELRGLGSPASYEHLQKAEALYNKLFWAEQHELVSALSLIAKSNAPEARSMLRSMLKNAMIDHAKMPNPSTLDFAKELVAEEAMLAQVLNELLAAIDGLKNDASIKAAEFDVKALHERRNKDVATLKILSGFPMRTR